MCRTHSIVTRKAEHLAHLAVLHFGHERLARSAVATLGDTARGLLCSLPSRQCCCCLAPISAFAPAGLRSLALSSICFSSSALVVWLLCASSSSTSWNVNSTHTGAWAVSLCAHCCVSWQVIALSCYCLCVCAFRGKNW